jgi:catechol 2,3-dioxygenase-like lactoylglutathione lyase family enzyme
MPVRGPDDTVTDTVPRQRRRETVAMGFHHVALATRDPEATHRFYTELMGFELVKVVAGPTPGEGDGFSKHFFYSTGSSSGDGDPGMIAFWDLHDPEIGDDYPVDLNATAGLPTWVNHIAFDAPTRDDLDARRRCWQEHGHRVMEVDHEFCVSIYLRDPSGNLVEFCHTTRPFTDDERRLAADLLADPAPPLTSDARITVHEPVTREHAGSEAAAPEPAFRS